LYVCGTDTVVSTTSLQVPISKGDASAGRNGGNNLFRMDGHKDLKILRACRASDMLAETKFTHNLVNCACLCTGNLLALVYKSTAMQAYTCSWFSEAVGPDLTLNVHEQ